MHPTYKLVTAYVPVPVSERLPDNVGETYFIINSRGLLIVGACMWMDKSKGIKQFYEQRADWNNYLIEKPIAWLEKKEDVYVLTKSELEELIELGAVQAFNAGRLLIESSSIEIPFEYESFADYLTSPENK